MEFIAKCRYQRLGRRDRPANVPGPLAALAVLGLLGASAPLGWQFALATQEMLQQSARSGFSPENATEARELVSIAVRVLAGTTVVSAVSLALWLVLKDLALLPFRAAFPGGFDAARRGPMSVSLNNGAAEISGTLSHISVQWPLVASAALKGGELVLTLRDGSAWAIQAASAPGGPEAALGHIRDALAKAAREGLR